MQDNFQFNRIRKPIVLFVTVIYCDKFCFVCLFVFFILVLCFNQKSLRSILLVTTVSTATSLSRSMFLYRYTFATSFSWNTVTPGNNPYAYNNRVTWSGFYLSVEKKLVLRLLRYMIGLKNSCQFFIQSEVKPKPIVTHSHAFSRALRQLPVITSSFDWFTVLCVFFVIG